MKPDILVRDYQAACAKLAAALGKKEASELERAGAIQYFELAFELAWKACKARAEELGLTEVRSPRAALREAMVQGWIREESRWLEMLEARNRMAHVYSAEQALEVFGRLADFSRALEDLGKRLGEG